MPQETHQKRLVNDVGVQAARLNRLVYFGPCLFYMQPVSAVCIFAVLREPVSDR